MPHKKYRTRDADSMALDYRCLQVRASSVNEEDRSIEAAISTETPVLEWDWERGERVNRVLLASGAQLPRNKQVPLLDSHNRYSVRDQLGSIRGITKTDGEVVGRLTFSSASESEWVKVREGHVTDVSAGFQIISESYIGKGDSRTIDGRQFTGPINIATKWKLREGSITPIGADEAAKMRGIDLSTLEKEKLVNEELRKRCIAAGMSESLSDEEAMAWLNKNGSRVFAPETPPTPTPTPTPTPAPAVDPDAIARNVSQQVITQMDEREALREQQRLEQREAFTRDVDATLQLLYGEEEGSVPVELRSSCLLLTSMDEVRKHVTEFRKKQQVQIPGSFRVDVVGSGQDNHRAALRSGFMFRALTASGSRNLETELPVAERANGWEEFSNLRMLDLARECLIADGYRYDEIRRLTSEQIAVCALGWPHKHGLRAAGYAYHTTGTLAVITQDAINKTLLRGYTEAPSTWREPFRQASSVADFKTIHRIKLSALGNLPVWNDNVAPELAALSNEEETYAVESRAVMIDFSWRLIVNDDMDALSRTPALMGAAAARTVNAVVWSQLTKNSGAGDTMADGQSLFLESATGARFRQNLSTDASSPPTTTTVSVLANLMRQMRGLNTPEGTESQDILNLAPRYLIVPSALDTTARVLINSIADPSTGVNPGTFNPNKGLTVVTEPLLDALSTTGWYLCADPGQIDTIEVTFLQGQETPVTNDWVNEETLSRRFSIIQTFAAKAIDHRGLQRQSGAA